MSIVFIEDTNVPAQELISMLREFLKDIFKVDIDKKKLPQHRGFSEIGRAHV